MRHGPDAATGGNSLTHPASIPGVVWSLLWIGWILAFFIIEGIALFNDVPRDTLSAHLRRWFRIDTKLGRTLFLVAFGGFVCWFGVHIITRLV